jgi:hypothetical protein
MRGYFKLAVGFVSCAVCASTSSAAPFKNLNFEQIIGITSAPANFVPFDAYQPVDSAAALPFWTVQEDNTVANALWSVPGLDETSVSMVMTNAIEGYFSVNLEAFAFARSPYYSTSAISQTGDVPVGAKSLHFLIRSPALAGGQIQATPIVTLNGTPISLFTQSSNGGIIEMAGDISSFAGTTSTLKFASAGSTASPTNIFYFENIYDLDAISFSTTPVPESSASLLACAGCFIGLSMRLHRREMA